MRLPRPLSALLVLSTLLAGCAQPVRQLQGEAGASHHWSGRMALQVQDSQQQSFSAGFELQGRPEQAVLGILSHPTRPGEGQQFGGIGGRGHGSLEGGQSGRTCLRAQ